VSAKLTTALKAKQDGLPIVSDQETVRTYLESWLVTVEPSVRPQTFRRYEQYVRLHSIPVIGSVRLSRLTPEHLQRLYSNRISAGLSPMSVRHLHAVLHNALGHAARWGKVARNVADLVSPLRAARLEMRTLSPEQARRLLDAAQGDRLEALYVLALTTGMRQGECLALRWQDVDLDGAVLSVTATLQRTKDGFALQEPKTARSRRQIVLTRHAVNALRQHRARQLEERLRCPYWQETDLEFTTYVGTPIEARNLMRREFYPLLERAGLPAIRFHDLRHSAATLMLGSGVHPKVASEMLGHSQIAVTLDLYSHVTPTMQAQAAEAMDALLASGSGTT